MSNAGFYSESTNVIRKIAGLVHEVIIPGPLLCFLLGLMESQEVLSEAEMITK